MTLSVKKQAGTLEEVWCLYNLYKCLLVSGSDMYLKKGITVNIYITE